MLARLLALAILSVALAAPAEAAKRRPAAAPARTDLSKSLVPLYPGVVGEYVQIPGAPSAGTPEPLATATFLRLRSAADGLAPKPVNAVIVAMPGFSSTPSHWLYLGAQLVQKSSERSCGGAPCRLEIWIVQRRGANLADTTGARLARAQGQPIVALDYYFDRVIGYDPDRPGRFPMGVPLKDLVGLGHSKWRPLEQGDVPFMADWGFETYAGDVDRMIALARQQSGARTVFLAGHSQGGGFLASYAGRLQGDGRRGHEKLAGLIFLDGGPSAGAAPMTDADLEAYLRRVKALRSGSAPVFTDATGPLGGLAGPVAGAATMVTSAYYALSDPNAESVFGPPAFGGSAASPAGDAFLRTLRLSWLARAGMTFDTDPLPGAGLQIPFLSALGEGLGQLDFRPKPGTEAMCDAYKEKPSPPGFPPITTIIAPVTCAPLPAQLDETRVYGWRDGAAGSPKDVGRAILWLHSQAYAPSRSSIRAAAVVLRSGETLSLDASAMPASNPYASERYDFDMMTFGRFRSFRIRAEGIDLDVDKAAIVGIPVYVARQSPAPRADNPFPGVSDFTEINRTGTYQTPAAKAVAPIDPAINAALYHHTDFVSADDSRAGQVRPGEPGSSVVANTLVDWVLKRAKGRAAVPTPASLSVGDIY
jgi:hypothetical protein